MKNKLLNLLVIAVVLLAVQPAMASKTITIGLDDKYPPLQSVGADGLPVGYDVDFTRTLMKRLGQSFYYVPRSWERIATEVLNGDIDLAMMVYSPYRKDSINYSHPIFRLYYVVVHRKINGHEFDFRNIKDKTFAYLDSRHIQRHMDREGAKGVNVNNLEESFLALAHGAYDGIICYRYQARYYIEKYGLSNLQSDEISLTPREYCYVSHNKDLIDAINIELDKMEAEGITDEIYGKGIKSSFDYNIPLWVWYLFAALAVLFIFLYFALLSRSRRRLEIANAMLETNYKILEMSHMELEDTNRQLIAANACAEESSKMKSNFIKQISHEIRTPLNILSGFTQLITTPGIDLPEEDRAKLNRGIVENTERIIGLVNKMLDLSDANSRTVIELTDDVPAEQIASDAITASCIADSRDYSFSLQLSASVSSVILHTNLASAVRALILLFDNARKFSSPKRQLQIILRTELTADSVKYIVEDTGIGVPADESEHIFDEFVQLNEYSEGTGIGLTVARSIARRLGGDIWLDTTYTSGARFIYSLPR